MKQLIDMNTLERVHYLKHYQGCKCLVMDPLSFSSGVIETVDIEDHSVLVKEEGTDRSTWVDASYVHPAIKTFKDLNGDDLETVINNISYRGRRFKYEEFTSVRQNPGAICLVLEEKDRSIQLYINQNWAINGYDDDRQITIDNMGRIIFLLCELGYDVANIFNEQ